MSLSYGKDYEYAANRVSGTVVLYKNLPVYIRRFERGGMCNGYYLGKSENENFNFKLDDCDLTPVPLGYVNEKYKSYMASRAPLRQYKQGLSSNCLVYYENELRPGRPRTLPRMGLGGRTSVNLVRCILGQYPDIDTCCELLVNEERESAAFSRNFCLQTDKSSKLGLFYKSKKVGFLEKEDFKLNKRFEFLEESLQECLR